MYNRLKGRRGPGKAGLAVAHAILVIAYHIIKNSSTYEDLGANFFDQINRERVVHKLTKRMQALGFDVTLKEHSPDPPAA